MSINFDGVEKGGRTFRPKGPDAPDTVITRPVGGAYEAITDYEVKKADSGPVLPTDPAPDSGNRGQASLVAPPPMACSRYQYWA